jgi:Mg2+ and Co2+ transporter CorA
LGNYKVVKIKSTLPTLTFATIIISVLALVASIFGMNVYLFDLQDNHYAFGAILVGSFVFAIALAWFFRRKRLM